MKTTTNIRHIAIIPARGNSKEILRKNLQTVGGEPLILRAINAAKGAKYISKVIVSSEDDEILSLALANGAIPHLRPIELSQDTTSSEDVLCYVLNKIREEGESLSFLTVFIQCTSPFIASADIDGAISYLNQTNSDSVFTVSKFNRFVWKHNQHGELVGINHDPQKRLRRQERESEYIETGALYVFKTEEFLITKHRFFGKKLGFLVPQSRSIEVDSLEDLIYANAVSSLAL